MSLGVLIIDHETVFNEVHRLRCCCFFFMAYSHCKLKNLPSKIGCRESPVCFCGFHNETAEHFFLERPLYYIPETNLLFSAARIFAERLSSMSKAQILAVFLFGSSLLSPEQNNDLIFSCPVFCIDEIL